MELDQKHYLERQYPLIKIAADSHIPNLEQKLLELFTAEYSLQYFEFDQLKSKDLMDMDALLVRSTVQVNQELCDNSQIQFVGSATAGINHLDTQYLDNQRIAWAHAPGCNAASVTHYVMAAIGELIQEGLFNVRQSVGIVGYGSIGKKLYQLLAALNIQVYAHDPFLDDPLLVGLDQILACDLITIHVPYSTAGAHPTSKMINRSHQKILKDKILINTSRGGVVCEALVLESQELIYIADVWQDEPTPSLDVINKAFIATSHIAGYSIEGKMNGTATVVEECGRLFKCLKDSRQEYRPALDWPHSLENIVRDMHGHGFPIDLFNSELNLRLLSDSLKTLSKDNLANGFQSLRAQHPPRHDFNQFSFKNIIELDEELNQGFFQAIHR